MKIGFDAKRLYNNFTGLGNYSRFIVEALSREYGENEYVLFSPKVKINSDTQYFLDAINIRTITPPASVSRLKLGSAWRTFRLGSISEKEDISIYHGLSHELPISVPKGIGKIVTIHDLIFMRYPQFYNRIDVAIYKAKVQHACKTADKIIAISQQTADDIESFLKVSPKKISVVYQGCHGNFRKIITEQQADEVRKKYELPDRFILNVGTIEPRKNALIIIKALKKLRATHEIPLVIVGKPTAYLNELKDFIISNNLTASVKFLHNVSFTDLPAIYRNAEVFIYPSLFEGFGIPLVEAMASGVPVISSLGSCFEEAAGPSSIYIDPFDDIMLADQIDKVLFNKDLREQMINNGVNYIKKFESRPIANDIMNVYKNVI